jgi:fructose-1,6-bisphosphatase I
MAAAGYILFGPSTILVYTRGQGVHGFTLDVGVGEFILSNESMRCPDRGTLVAADVGRYPEWKAPVRRFVDGLLGRDGEGQRRASVRHSGAFVADVHRILLEGGLYFYPANADHPKGKLRLLYECAPLALVVEQAGGRASTGQKRILDLRPESPHQQVPLVIGSRENVAEYERFQASSGP